MAIYIISTSPLWPNLCIFVSMCIIIRSYKQQCLSISGIFSSSSTGLKESPRMPLAESVLRDGDHGWNPEAGGSCLQPGQPVTSLRSQAVPPDLNLLRWNRGKPLEGRRGNIWHKQITTGTVWHGPSTHAFWAVPQLKIQPVQSWSM